MEYLLCNLKRIFYLLIIYSTSRLFFYICNSDVFKSDLISSFLEGVRFDISPLYINMYYILLIFPTNLRTNRSYVKFTNILFYTLNLPFIILNNFDIEYFKFTQKRTTYDFFEYLTLAKEMTPLTYFLNITDYWYITL